MIKRGVATAVGAKTIRVDTDDIDIIKKTTFTIKNQAKPMRIDNIVLGPEENLVIQPNSTYMFERGNYVTISNNDKFDYDEIIRSLSLRAYKVFKYIKRNIQYNSNYIILPVNTILGIINDKYPSNASLVIRELIKKQVIDRCPETNESRTFVINHGLFFKGSYNRFAYKYLNKFGEVNNSEDENYEDYPDVDTRSIKVKHNNANYTNKRTVTKSKNNNEFKLKPVSEGNIVI